MKKLTIHIKPHMQGIIIAGHEIKPIYGISKVDVINGELTYITHHNGKEIFIPKRWVQNKAGAQS